MYLYQTIILKNPINFKKSDGTNQLSASDIAAHQVALSDFETNFRSIAIPIIVLTLAQTTFVVDKTYSAFKALIVTPITWGDVKYTDDTQKYVLSLLRDTLL